MSLVDQGVKRDTEVKRMRGGEGYEYLFSR